MADFPRNHLKNTARGIIIHDGRLLLMERWRDELHYFSIPGGGIEPGETPEETVVRELREETTVIVKVQRQVLEMHDEGFSHKIYLCEYVNGEPRLPDDAPEAAHGKENRFKPVWVPLSMVPGLPFAYWQPVKQMLVEGLQQGFGTSIEIASASSGR
jgi:8-oxo-dGTP diphosphatase